MPKSAAQIREDASTRLDASVWKIVSVAVLGSLLSQLDATVINVSLSSLATEMHTTLAAIQWVTSGYLLALALVLPLNGWLVDRIGAKALYLWCFSTFTLSSALCGFAWSANSLIAFRVLQGISGGLLAPMAQMMLARAAGPRRMARVSGYAALPVMLGPILGPVLAGAILRYATWRWLFFINLPVGALAILLAWRFLPNDREESRPRSLDLTGLFLLSPGLVLFLYAADRIGTHTGEAVLVLAVFLLALFLRHARRPGSAAVVDIQLFRGTFAVAATTQFLSNGIMFAGQMLIPFFLIRACGLSAQASGWALAPMGLGMLCTYPLMGTLTERFGIRKVSATGAVLSLGATLPFVIMASHELHRPMLFAALFLRGIGMGAIGIPSISAAYASVPRHELPMATTSLNIVQRIGGPSLTTILATFLAWRLTPSAHLATAFTDAFALLCVFHLLQCFSAMRLPLTISSGKAETSAVAETLAD